MYIYEVISYYMTNVSYNIFKLNIIYDSIYINMFSTIVYNYYNKQVNLFVITIIRHII